MRWCHGRWSCHDAHSRLNMEIAGRVTKQPPDRFDWLFTKRDAYHDPNMLPDLDAAEERRHDARPRLCEIGARRQAAHRPEHRRSGGEAAEIRAEATRLQGSYAETVTAVLVTATHVFPLP